MKSALELVQEAKQQIDEVSVDEADQFIQQADVLIDVREPGEYQNGHLPGAINIPRGMLEFQVGSDPKLESRDTGIVLYCKTSGRAALATQSLKTMGYLNIKSITGGFDAWAAAGKPITQPHLPDFD